ncbi:hypothetical protein HG536_0E02820 [Torulaspora globosa]|uniref:Protein phosphatase methylesterase 1 n=1 Tax=Torulaspora globosa TaxID=48254 RepID=A0A7G3ZIN5_9SACH|nr:uncharacterized protein HG536_0E02820 [Torulaspora globosa]QLL33371.1 hypothetical protein HG536_0E02820 [Torulaspora globosa]
MEDHDLRRKIALKQLKQAKIASAEEEETDIVQELPSRARHSVEFQETLLNERDGQPADVLGWEQFFEHNERYSLSERNFEFNTYFTLPKSCAGASIPIFVFHHGAGSSGLTFANLSKQLVEKLEGKCGVFSFDARGHAQTRPIDLKKEVTYELEAFIYDFVTLVDLFYKRHLEQLAVQKLSFIFVGHSLGASICTFAYARQTAAIKEHTLGVCMLDIVEEAAIQALQKVHSFLASTPNVFNNYREAVDWHVQRGLSSCRESAQVAIPALFAAAKSQKIVRITNLNDFRPYWHTWFQHLSHSFVALPTNKLLLLAGNDNLDKELIIGQMQGKYQLVVFQDSGHFIQEDVPRKTAITLIDFWKRNDSRSAVIKTNWGKN